MNWAERIEVDPKRLAGKLVARSTSITVELGRRPQKDDFWERKARRATPTGQEKQGCGGNDLAQSALATVGGFCYDSASVVGDGDRAQSLSGMPFAE